jgi:hypothetical protein
MSSLYFSRKVLSLWLAALVHLSSISSTPDNLLLSRWGRDGHTSHSANRFAGAVALNFVTVPSELKGLHKTYLLRCLPRPCPSKPSFRRESLFQSTISAKEENDQGLLTTVNKLPVKRGRGIGKNLVVSCHLCCTCPGDSNTVLLCCRLR